MSLYKTNLCSKMDVIICYNKDDVDFALKQKTKTKKICVLLSMYKLDITKIEYRTYFVRPIGPKHHGFCIFPSQINKKNVIFKTVTDSTTISLLQIDDIQMLISFIDMNDEFDELPKNNLLFAFKYFLEHSRKYSKRY